MEEIKAARFDPAFVWHLSGPFRNPGALDRTRSKGARRLWRFNPGWNSHRSCARKRLTADTRRFQRHPRPGNLASLPIYLNLGFKCRNSIHFTTCCNFEQSLPKWVTCHEFWSTNPALRLIVRSSGGPSLGRSPGAHKQRRPVNQDQSPIRENRVDTIFGAGLSKSCSFFIVHRPENIERRSRARWSDNPEQARCRCIFHFRIARPRCHSNTDLPSHWQIQTTECPCQTVQTVG